MMNVVLKTNFGGVLEDIEAKKGIRITTLEMSRKMPIGYGQALKLRKDETKRFDTSTLEKFIQFCSSFGVTVMPNDIFKFKHIEQTEG